MRKIDQLFAEYAESHQNQTNKFIHWICVPLTQITQLKFFEISLWGNPKFRRTIFCVFW
jgi:uncharacterized membrane protein YGL010W